MKNFSLKYKLFFVFAALIFIYACFSVLFVNFYLKDALRKHLIDTGRSTAANMSAYIVDDMLIRDFVAVDLFFENTMKNNPEVAYVFIEKDGKVLIHTFDKGFPKGLLNLGHKKDAIDYVLVKGEKEAYYDFSAPVFGGRAGTLRLGMSVGKVEDVLDGITRSLLYVALTAVAIALVLSVTISKKLTSPLSQLTASAMKIADGDYSKTVPESGSDEVGRLSSAFNKMVGAVKIREKELREINEELELINVRLHEYIEELNRTKDELVKSKQDMAVFETSRAMIHHVKQPLTYLIMAIEMFTDEIHGGNFNADVLQKKLFAIEEAGKKVSEILKKFEALKEYRSVEYSDETKIVDIGE